MASSDFDPYHAWLGIPPDEQPPDYYRLVGVRRFEKLDDVILNASDQRMSFLRQLQIGPRAAESQRLLNEVAAATYCLLDPIKRRAYDEHLQSQHAGRMPLNQPPTIVSPDPAPPPIVAGAYGNDAAEESEVNQATDVAPLPLAIRMGAVAIGLFVIVALLALAAMWSGSLPLAGSGSSTAASSTQPLIANAGRADERLKVHIPLAGFPQAAPSLVPDAAFVREAVQRFSRPDPPTPELPPRNRIMHYKEASASQEPVDATTQEAYIDLSPLGGEHRLLLEFTRQSNAGSLALAFPYGASTCVLVLDQKSDEGLVSGLERVRGFGVGDQGNPTTISKPCLKSGIRQQLIIEAQRNCVLVELDGQPLMTLLEPCFHVSGSKHLYPPSPRRTMLKIWDGAFQIHHFDHAAITSPVPSNIEPIPAASDESERPRFAAAFGRKITLEAQSRPLLDYREPFTFECWFRQLDANDERVKFAGGQLQLELEKLHSFTQTPVVILGSIQGGNWGAIPSFDAAWHHVAVCNDLFHTELFWDGKFACRIQTSFQLPREETLIQLGGKDLPGPRFSPFKGQVRDLRISQVVRYPLGKQFTPPDVFGIDQHVLCLLDFRTAELQTRFVSAELGKVTLAADGMAMEPLE